MRLLGGSVSRSADLTSLPEARDLLGQPFGRAARVERHDRVAAELVPEPGLLTLGVLPGRDRDRLRDVLAPALPVKILDGLTDPDPVESGRAGGMSFGQHSGHLLD